MFGHQSEAHTPLADCALWALRDLAAKLRQPGGDSFVIVEQVVFAAKALKAYRAEVDGRIPSDFISRALDGGAEVRSLDSSIEELLVSATAIAAVEDEDHDSSDEAGTLSSVGAWLASACLRRSRRTLTSSVSHPQAGTIPSLGASSLCNEEN